MFLLSQKRFFSTSLKIVERRSLKRNSADESCFLLFILRNNAILHFCIMHRRNGIGNIYALFYEKQQYFDEGQYSYFLKAFILQMFLLCYFLSNIKNIKKIIKIYISFKH